MNDLERARAAADAIRATHPEKAAEIDKALKDGVPVRIGMRYRLEKFHAPMKPGDAPYEVIEGEDR
jgi:DNA-binding Lrp family transcriptional regulator